MAVSELWRPVAALAALLSCSACGPTLDPPPRRARDPWSLWTHGTQLRGANIYQRRVYQELDHGWMGPGPVGPVYSEQDIRELARLGANYVHVSHPGLFREKPPYDVDPAVVRNLDRLLDLIAREHMFAVIAFRTGPGRSEFTFLYDSAGTWFGASYLDDHVWDGPAPQRAWAKMWRYAAARYRGHPAVVGYELMVEPNAQKVRARARTAADFYPRYAGTSWDWNVLARGLTDAVRSVDPDMPILVSPMGYGSIDWLEHLVPTGDRRTVYAVHNYGPFAYTHQSPEDRLLYPDEIDLDGDGRLDSFDKTWLDARLAKVADFQAQHPGPAAITEFGLRRWAPGGADYIDDQMELFERHGFNHALWLWHASGRIVTESEEFNFLHSPTATQPGAVTYSDLIDSIVRHWQRNTVRPR